jgi:hypothetical protein
MLTSVCLTVHMRLIETRIAVLSNELRFYSRLTVVRFDKKLHIRFNSFKHEIRQNNMKKNLVLTHIKYTDSVMKIDRLMHHHYRQNSFF